MRRTKKDTEQTRSAIIDAAERLFAEKDISATTLAAISRAAEVTRGAFYRHFKDKADFTDALCARRSLPQQELLSRAVEEGHPDPLSLLETAGHEVLAIFAADEGQQRLFSILSNHGEDSEVAGRIDEHNRDLFNLLRRVMEQAQRTGTLNPNFAPQEAAALMLVTMNGLLSEWLRSSRTFSLADFGRKILSVLGERAFDSRGSLPDDNGTLIAMSIGGFADRRFPDHLLLRAGQIP